MKKIKILVFISILLFSSALLESAMNPPLTLKLRKEEVFSRGRPLYSDGLLIYTDGQKVTFLDARRGNDVYSFKLPARLTHTHKWKITEGKLIFLSEDGSLYAVDAKDGALLWKKKIYTSIENYYQWNFDVQNGRIYTALERNGAWEIAALDINNGNIVWLKLTGNTRMRCVLAEKDLYAVTQDKIYCLIPEDGSEKWSYNTYSAEFAKVTSNAKTLFVFNGTTRIIALDRKTGELKWKRFFSHFPWMAADEETFYFARESKVYAVHAETGNTLFERPFDGISFGALAIDEKSVYVVINSSRTGRATIFAIDKKNGDFIWTYNLQADHQHGNFLLADKTLYLFSSSRLFLFSDTGTDNTLPNVTLKYPPKDRVLQPGQSIIFRAVDMESGINPLKSNALIDSLPARLYFSHSESSFYITPLEKLEAGKHSLVFSVKDYAGNETKIEMDFLFAGYLPTVVTGKKFIPSDREFLLYPACFVPGAYSYVRINPRDVLILKRQNSFFYNPKAVKLDTEEYKVKNLDDWAAADVYGNVMIGALTNRLTAYNLATGEKIWESSIVSERNAYVRSIATDGKVVCVVVENTVLVFDFNTGYPRFRFTTDHRQLYRPLITEEKIIITGEDTGCDPYIYCLNKNTGRTEWRFSAVPIMEQREGTPYYSIPLLYENLVLFSLAGTTYALDIRNGNTVYEIKLYLHDIRGNSAISFSGEWLVVFRPKDGTIIWGKNIGEILSNLFEHRDHFRANVSDEFIFVVSYSGVKKFLNIFNLHTGELHKRIENFDTWISDYSRIYEPLFSEMFGKLLFNSGSGFWLFDSIRPKPLIDKPMELVSSKTEDLLYPSFSPDGREIIYTGYGKKGADIYIQNISKGRRKRITRGGLNWAGALSPDNMEIAFLSTRKEIASLYVTDRNQRHLKRLTVDETVAGRPSWIDGDTLLFSSLINGRHKVMEVKIGKEGAVPATKMLFPYFENDQWQPKRQPGKNDIISLSNESGVAIEKVVYSGPPHILSAFKKPGAEFPEDIHFMPDGNILFTLELNGKKSIWIFLEKEGILKPVILDELAYSHPAVSPDGKKIIYSKYQEGRWSIYMADLLIP